MPATMPAHQADARSTLPLGSPLRLGVSASKKPTAQRRYNLKMNFPRLMVVRQNFPDRRIVDVPGEVRKQLAASQFARRLAPGSRVAIGLGSRGIANIAVIARGVVDYWK